MSETTAELAPKKSCDRCRSRKVRCDRGSPCSNCQRAKAQCITSPRVSRPRRRRVLLSSEYEGKLSDLDRKLDQVGRFMDIIASNSAPRRMANDSELPTPSPPDSSTTSRCAIDPPAGRARSPRQECRSIQQHTNDRVAANPGHDDERVAEGFSSLSANSTFAIDLLHRVAGADRERGHDFETRELLDMLQRIVNAIKCNRLSAGQSLPLAPPLARTGRDDCTMPSIHAAVAAIRKAQEQSNIALQFLSELLQSPSLSDLCLKVYFSQDYSVAEYIIINIALYYLFDKKDAEPIDRERSDDSSDGYRLMCQANLEAALAGLPLCFKATYDMVLALALGTIYAVEISKPALAWVYASAAQQTSYSLGFHTRSIGADDGCNVPNQMGLLFWTIYYLEKTLCLRLGRGSSILDIEITVPMPASSDPAMSYCRQQVRFASLAGRTYERLYSPNALSQPDETRTQRVSELSRELSDIRSETSLATTHWLRATADKQRQELINFIATSDEVLCQSMRTLVLRAARAQPDSPTTFTSDCVHAARATLESHQANMSALTKVTPSLLSSYLHWTILFSPFIPFIVLFCHTIETGHGEDLDRMHTFIRSLESACQHSSAIAKHHDLFQLFYNVAVRYTDMKLASTPSQPEQAELRVEMGSYLSELGFQAQHGIQNAAGGGGQGVSTEFLSMTLPHDVSGGQAEAGQAAQLANWYAVSQQMMGLLDNNQLPF